MFWRKIAHCCYDLFMTQIKLQLVTNAHAKVTLGSQLFLVYFSNGIMVWLFIMRTLIVLSR